MGQRRREFRRTTVVSAGLLSFLLGLIAARYVGLASGWWLGVLLLVPLLYRRNILSVLSIMLIGGLLGLWRGSVFMQKLLPYQQLTRQAVTITAIASSDAVYADKGQLEFDVGSIVMTQPYRTNLPGTIEVRGYGETMVYRGDKVMVQAKLYQARGSRQGRMSFAQVARVHTSSGIVNTVRRRFAAGLQSAVPEPLGSLGLGILIGQRSTLPEWFDRDMSTVGLTHIVAVSGYNLTIMVQVAQRLARKRSKYQAMVLMVVFVLGFVMVTGSSASIVRAAIVSMLSIWAWYYGRSFKPHVLILLAAALTAGWFPPYLWSDLGWHLSFLAFIGVLIVAPAFQARYLRTKPRIILQLCIETTAAQLMTLPIILFSFGRLSVIALVANMLVVPPVPLAMLCSFIAGIAGAVATPLAGWVAWPATLIMTYMVDVVALLARVPHASTEVYIRLWHLVVCYGLLSLMVVLWWRKTPKSVKVRGIHAAPLTEPVVSSPTKYDRGVT
jgi:competence protein ComEC